MEDKKFLEKQESDIAIHVFSVSSAMIGVCFTVIGIINFINIKETIVDEITAVDALIFLIACVSSYRAMKIKDPEKRFLLEKRVDFIFIFGLTLMGLICIFMALNFI